MVLTILSNHTAVNYFTKLPVYVWVWVWNVHWRPRCLSPTWWTSVPSVSQSATIGTNTFSRSLGEIPATVEMAIAPLQLDLAMLSTTLPPPVVGVLTRSFPDLSGYLPEVSLRSAQSLSDLLGISKPPSKFRRQWQWNGAVLVFKEYYWREQRS